MPSNDIFLISEYLSKLTRYIWQKINEYFLYGTIIITILTVILILSIVFESKIDYFQINFLNWLINSSNHFQKYFLNQLITSLNKNILLKTVIVVHNTNTHTHTYISDVLHQWIDLISSSVILGKIEDRNTSVFSCKYSSCVPTSS